MLTQALWSASSSMQQMKIMQSANSQKQNNINLLKSQIKQDSGDAVKEKEVEKLEEESLKLYSSLMGALEDTAEKVTDPEKLKEETKAEEIQKTAEEKEEEEAVLYGENRTLISLSDTEKVEGFSVYA